MGEPLIIKENKGEDSMLILDGSNCVHLAYSSALPFQVESQTFCDNKTSVEL